MRETTEICNSITGFPVQRWQKAFVRIVACLVYRADRISRNVAHPPSRPHARCPAPSS
jgi:hypothetical protein